MAAIGMHPFLILAAMLGAIDVAPPPPEPEKRDEDEGGPDQMPPNKKGSEE